MKQAIPQSATMMERLEDCYAKYELLRTGPMQALGQPSTMTHTGYTAFSFIDCYRDFLFTTTKSIKRMPSWELDRWNKLIH